MKSCGKVSIKLSSVAANWCYLKALCDSSCEVGAVVKTNAYGLGAEVIAKTLYQSGCKTFFFITPEEAKVIECILPADCRYVILGGFRVENESLFLNNNFIPVIHSFESLNRWRSFSRQLANKRCILKVDTGMSRLGLCEHEVDVLCAMDLQDVEPIYVMSHLACADEYQHVSNSLQLASFNRSFQKIKIKFPSIQGSLSNSSGMFLGQDWHYQLCRPGAALYGINPTPHHTNPLKNTVSLELPILQMKCLEKMSPVGYGGQDIAPAGTCLAVVAGGYADGINRILGEQPEGIINGHKVRTLGRMSMDSIIFDLTSIPVNERPEVGDYVSVINDTFTLDYLMNKTKSLGYEILTAIGPRIERCYVQD